MKEFARRYMEQYEDSAVLTHLDLEGTLWTSHSACSQIPNHVFALDSVHLKTLLGRCMLPEDDEDALLSPEEILDRERKKDPTARPGPRASHLHCL